MNNRIIKVLNQEKAQELIDLGFRCVTETMNGKIIHSFFLSEEIIAYVNKNFDKHTFLLSNKITF